MASTSSAASKRKRAGVASPESPALALAVDTTSKSNGNPHPKRQRANSGRAVDTAAVNDDNAESGKSIKAGPMEQVPRPKRELFLLTSIETQRRRMSTRWPATPSAKLFTPPVATAPTLLQSAELSASMRMASLTSSILGMS